jgi:hypothetical protein
LDTRYYTETEADALFLTAAEGDALFLTPAEGNAAYDALGAAAAAVAAHEAAGDPHPQYLTAAEGDALFLTPAEGNALYSPLGHNHDHGVLTGLGDNDHPQYLLVADIDDIPVNGVINAPISSNWAFDHVAAADPHIQYLLESAYTAADVLAKLLTVDGAGSLLDADLLDGLSSAAFSLVGHTHLLAAGATDVTMTTANLNSLDDGVNSALHFHDSDRARVNHTGTQLLATISDVTITVANLNTLDDGVNTALHFHNTDRARANHTGTQILTTISDVSITAANLNTLDDGVDTSLHFHAADRARSNHTGTQLAATVSDFSEAVDDRVAALLIEGEGIDLTYDDGANTLTVKATQLDLSNLIDGVTETIAANKCRTYNGPLTITNGGVLAIPATSQVAILGS